MISLQGVAKHYPDGTVAVHDLDLDIPEGDIAVLVGPSGCGKTTTMRMINRLIEPSSGRIVIGGDDVTRVDPVELRRRIGYVIQQVGLFPHQTVGANVSAVPRLLGWDKRAAEARSAELLELVGLDPGHFARRYPAELSGGQRQRVGVARALAADPPVLLMDEPFGAVDPIARERLQAEFLRLQQTVRKTIVFVTHDVDEAVRLGDRIAVMRDGSIEQYAAPTELLTHPASDFVADFVGAEHSLRRLRVAGIDPSRLQRWPVVDPGDRVADRAALLNGHGLVVASGTTVTGVITSGTDLAGRDGTAGGVASAVAVVALAEPLESALAAMLATPQAALRDGATAEQAVAVVTDGEGIAGVLTLQALLDSARGGAEPARDQPAKDQPANDQPAKGQADPVR
jgi:osmoprotectant transport system ATP-binding protein